MASETAELSDDLAEFQQRFARIPDIEETPRTLLHVLGRETRETYWNEILSYFLDPTEPHGFGTEFLEAFLSVLESNVELEFEYDRRDLDDVEVRSEWVLRDLEVRPDITIYSGRRWFVIVEMKVRASEGDDQTSQYVRSEKVGSIDKSEFGEPKAGSNKEYESGTESGHSYVYLAPNSAADSEASAFVDVSWREVTKRLERFERRSHGRYPAKSHAQLDDFLDTIERELSMTDERIEQNQLDKMQLYFEYADAINEVQEALDKVHDRERERWSERFSREFKPENWSDDWNCAPGDFGHIYHDRWRLTGKREPTAVNDVPYRVSFVHDIRDRDSFEQGSLTFRLYCPLGTDDEFSDEFGERFHGDEVINEFFGDRRNNGNKMWLTESRYPFDREELPESYYKTLQTAFEDHREIADDVTRVFDGAVNKVSDETR